MAGKKKRRIIVAIVWLSTAVGFFALGALTNPFHRSAEVVLNENHNGVRYRTFDAEKQPQVSEAVSTEGEAAGITYEYLMGLVTPPSPHGYTQFNKALEALTPANVDTFIRALDSIPDGATRNDLLWNALVRWAAYEGEGKAAMKVADRIPGLLRPKLMVAVASSWARTDPQAAWEMMMEYSDGGRNRVFNLSRIFRSIVYAEPALAFQYFDELPDYGGGRQGDFREITRSLANLGKLEEGLPLLRKMEESRHSRTHLEYYFTTWGRFDAATAFSAIDSLPAGAEREPALEGALSGWSTINPPEAADFALKLPESEMRNRVINTVFSRWSASGKVNEIAAFLNQQPVDGTTDLAISNIVGQFAVTDPNAAFQWADSIVGPEIRQKSRKSVFHHMIDADPESAASYVESLTNVEERDEMLGVLARTFLNSRNDLSRAMTFVGQIANENQRRSAVGSIGSQLYLLQRHAGMDYATLIDQINAVESISDDTRNVLIEMITEQESQSQ